MGVELLRSKGAGGDRFGVYHAGARRQGWGWAQRKTPSYGLPRKPVKSSVVCRVEGSTNLSLAKGDGLAAVPILDHSQLLMTCCAATRDSSFVPKSCLAACACVCRGVVISYNGSRNESKIK